MQEPLDMDIKDEVLTDDDHPRPGTLAKKVRTYNYVYGSGPQSKKVLNTFS